jgi:P-type Ca2+ transporter type 2C
VTLLGFIAPAATLLPLQILFLNMVTDVFPALALGLGKGNENVMNNTPRRPEDPIISNKDWLMIVLYALAITLSVIGAVYYCRLVLKTVNVIANNVAFITLAFAQLFHVFNMSSVNSHLLVNDITKNKFVWLAILICTTLMVFVFIVPQIRYVLRLTELQLDVWIVAIVASLIPLALVQLYKLIFEKRTHK